MGNEGWVLYYTLKTVGTRRMGTRICLDQEKMKAIPNV